MDWGLLRSSKQGFWGLRNKISYGPQFYYFAVFVNFFLRFFWLFSIWNFDYGKSIFGQGFESLQILTFLAILAETTRRALWALIRVENEFHNNFENYRSIPTIPALADDFDAENDQMGNG